MAKRKKNKSRFGKMLKFSFISFFVLLLLVILLPYLFRGKIMEYAEDVIHENVNAEISLGGMDLTLLSTFPKLTFQIDDLKVVGKDEFKDVVLTDIGNISLELNLWKVISGGKYQITAIGMEDVDMDVRVLSSGVANWDIAVATEETETEEEVPEVESSESSPISLKLEHFYFRRFNLSYVDATMDIATTVNNFNLEGGTALNGDLLDLTTSTLIDAIDLSFEGVEYLKKTHFTFDSEFGMDMEKMRFTFGKNEASINQLPFAFQGFFQMNEADYDMDISFESKNAEFKSLLSLIPAIFLEGFEGIKTAGNFGFDGKVYGKYNEEGEMPGFDFNLNVDNGSFKYPDLPGSVQNIAIESHINRKPGSNLDNLIVNVPKFNLDFAGNPIKTKLLLTHPMSDPNIDCGIVAHFDLAKIKEIIPVEEGMDYNGIIDSDIELKGKLSALDNEDYESFKAIGGLTISKMIYESSDLNYDVNINTMVFNFSPQNLELASFDAMIGESDIKASGTIDNYLAYYLREEPLKGEFVVNSDLLDLNELMAYEPVKDEVKEKGEMGPSDEEVTEGESTEVSDELEVIEIPKNIDFKLHNDLKDVIYDNIHIKNIKGDINIADQKASMDHVTMDMLGGSMELNGSYDTKDVKKPHVDFSYNIKDFFIDKTAETFATVEKLAPVAKSLKGLFSTQMKMSTDLDKNLMPVWNTINGGGDLNTKELFIDNLEILNKIASKLKINKLSKQNLDNLNMNFELLDGKIFVKPFDVKLGKIKTTVGGWTAVDQTIGYDMVMDIPRSAFGSFANEQANHFQSLASSKGVDVKLGDVIPVKLNIGGTFLEPKIKSDFNKDGKGALSNVGDAVKAKAKEEITKEVKKKVEEVKEKAGEEAAKLIANAEGKAAQLVKEAEKLAAKTKEEGYAQAQKLQDEAKGPLRKAAAKVGADKLRKESDKKADKIVEEAKIKSQKIIDEAKEKASKLE